jgi:inosine-uridine nucleoside N-ribohydrolase
MLFPLAALVALTCLLIESSTGYLASALSPSINITSWSIIYHVRIALSTNSTIESNIMVCIVFPFAVFLGIVMLSSLIRLTTFTIQKFTDPIPQPPKLSRKVLRFLKSKYGRKKSSRSSRATGHFVRRIAIETDIGHDCDDIQALMVALADHIAGRIKIVWISTVSQNNAERAKLVQYICSLYGVTDIPILVTEREVATSAKTGNPLNNVVKLWQYVRGSLGFVKDTTKELPITGLCPIFNGQYALNIKLDSVKHELSRIRVLIIGPGTDPNFWIQIPDENSIEAVVQQGGYKDTGPGGSFNVSSDGEAAEIMVNRLLELKIPFICIDKTIAYITQLKMEIFNTMASVAHEKFGIDLQKIMQLGVMEFRDGVREIFNKLNYKSRIGIEHLLIQDSLSYEWFNKLVQLPPMYDITAYLLLRDLDLETMTSPWYRLVQFEDKLVQSEYVWVVPNSHAGLQDKHSEYMKKITDEMFRAVFSFDPPIC